MVFWREWEEEEWVLVFVVVSNKGKSNHQPLQEGKSSQGKTRADIFREHGFHFHPVFPLSLLHSHDSRMRMYPPYCLSPPVSLSMSHGPTIWRSSGSFFCCSFIIDGEDGGREVALHRQGGGYRRGLNNGGRLALGMLAFVGLSKQTRWWLLMWCCCLIACELC